MVELPPQNLGRKFLASFTAVPATFLCSNMNAIDKTTVLRIYKALLKSAKVFPSKRRPNIIAEIKLSMSRGRIAIMALHHIYMNF